MRPGLEWFQPTPQHLNVNDGGVSWKKTDTRQAYLCKNYRDLDCAGNDAHSPTNFSTYGLSAVAQTHPSQTKRSNSIDQKRDWPAAPASSNLKEGRDGQTR